MSKLFTAIQADADKHLPLPSGRRPGEEIERYQRFLKRQTMRIRLAHNEGLGGREICRARSFAVDLVFTHAIQAAEALPENAGGAGSRPFAVVVGSPGTELEFAL